MFYFLCNSILHAGRKALSAHKLLHLQEYTSIISLKHISSNANRHSFTVSYLMNSCGLSLESALSASKYVHFENQEKPDSALDFLKNNGFSKTQITNLIRRLPQVLSCSPENTLLPKFEFFQSKGMSNPEIVKILSICPGLFHRSLGNHIIPTFNSLSDLLQSSRKGVAVIKHFPLILYHNFEHYLLPNVNILRGSGVPDSNIVKFIDMWPNLGLTYPKYFEANVEIVKDMGINPLRSQFFLAIKAKIGMSKSLWERKLDVYKKWGWSDEEFLAAFAKYPWCMLCSIDKITAGMEFFVNEMGWESSVIAKRPILISLSMEKRIIPRAAIIKFLLSKGLVKSDITYFSTLLLFPEKIFLQRFLNSFDDAPELLKLYKAKLSASKKIK